MFGWGEGRACAGSRVRQHTARGNAHNPAPPSPQEGDGAGGGGERCAVAQWAAHCLPRRPSQTMCGHPSREGGVPHVWLGRAVCWTLVPRHMAVIGLSETGQLAHSGAPRINYVTGFVGRWVQPFTSAKDYVLNVFYFIERCVSALGQHTARSAPKPD